MEQPSKGSIVSAMFLVGGTCIGGGMLALPLATGLNGFLPSVVVMLVCWVMMTATALLLLEATFWMEEGVHVSTLTARLLGRPGQVISWILFLFVSYASLVAYTAGAGSQLSSAAEHYFSFTLSKDVAAIVFLVVLGLVIDLGSAFVGRVNSIMFIALVAAYVGLVVTGLDEVKPELLGKRSWAGSYTALPLLLTAFSFQTMVPSLTPYLKRNLGALRIAIIGGTTIALVIYSLWQVIILGIVPVEGADGLSQAFAKGEPITQFLHKHVDGVWIAWLAEYFAFFAIATSFLGMGLGLFDFLADALHIKKTKWGRIRLALLVAVPTLIFALKFERVFLTALDATGGYGDTILNGLIPVAMVWVGRYHWKRMDKICLPGGKPALVVIFAFFLIALLMEILLHSGQIASIDEIYGILGSSV